MGPRSRAPILRQHQRSRGFSAIYTAVILVAVSGMVSLGVDYGRVQVAKAELQTAADAAARSAAAGLATSASQARTDAVDMAAANTSDGSAVALDSTADVEFGNWNTDTRTFTLVSSGSEDSAGAVRVTARRVASRSNAIPLVFARVVGRSTCDIHAVAIATLTVGSAQGFVGLNGVTVKNNAFFASYKSASNTNPTEASAASHGGIGSNGVITVNNNAMVKGDVQLGPSGSVSGTPTITGTTRQLSSAIPTPAYATWTPSTNPGGISQSYTVNSNTSLLGGTYWFTSLTINADLSFTGPATLYVNGNVDLNARLTASGSIPANLKIYQIGSGRTFGDSSNNSMDIVAVIEAPGSDFTAKNNFQIRGGAIFNTITLKNNGDFFYDAALGPAGGSTSIGMVR